MTSIGYVDIEHDEIERYLAEVAKKKGICDFLPAGRFYLRNDGPPRFGPLVCSDKMGGKQTGTSASSCRNCLLEKEGVPRD